MNDQPRRTATYVSAMQDSRIWARFALRPGDVVVTTPPKCGTTWTQALVLSLLFGRPGMDRDMGDLSIWLDPGFRDQDAIAAMFEAQTHRRCIKTHTPFDGIAFDPEVTYLSVYRHPIDAHFSMRRHNENALEDIHDGRLSGTPSETFAQFLAETPQERMGDGNELKAFVHHFRTVRSWVHLPNVHMFHYADMRRDLAGHTRAIARCLGVDLSDALLDEIAASLRFERMQANARDKATQSAQSVGTFKDPAAFFHSASSRKWEGVLGAAEIEAYRERLAGLVPEAEARWLEEGGPLP